MAEVIMLILVAVTIWFFGFKLPQIAKNEARNSKPWVEDIHKIAEYVDAKNHKD